MKIALSVLIAMFFVACSQEKNEEKVLNKVATEVVAKQEVAAVVSKKVEKKELTKNSQEPKNVVQVDGAKLFVKCSSCHGKTAEKKALNKSQVIKGWKSEQIISALKGYKDGTYGSSMKGVMKSQAANLSDAQIQALAKYISDL